MSRKIISILFLLIFVLSGCGSKTCKNCGNEIGPDEHTTAANQFIQNCSNEDVFCEDCQLEYSGIIVGHCMRCLEEFKDGAPIYYGYEYEGDHFDIGICEICATEVWGNDRDTHLPSGICSTCGVSFDARPEYENTGVCEACAKLVYN